MWRWAIMVAVWAAVPAGAQPIRVRAGEHPGFTRVVLPGVADAGWRIGRVDGGYGVQIDGNDLNIDVSAAFAMIPRHRLTQIEPGPEPGSLRLGIGCDCHLRAFVLARGALVIDIADGAPTAASAFELPLRGGDAAQGAIVPEPRDPLPPFWRRTAPGANAPGNVLPPPAPGPRADPPAENFRVGVSEDLLRWQLSRAIAQGLVTLSDAPLTDGPVDAEAAVGPPEAADIAGDEGIPIADHVTAQTAFDRAFPDATRTMATDAAACPPADSLHVAAWGTDAEPLAQLVAARQALLGEFDRPNVQATIDLARLYIRFGWGVEARALVRAYPLESADGQLLPALAGVLEGDDPADGDPLASIALCGDDGAFWAFVGTPGAELPEKEGREALLRVYAGLPPTLRSLLLEHLTRRFLQAGDRNGAQILRDAAGLVAEPGVSDAAGLGAIDAEIGLNGGSAERLAEALLRVGVRPDPGAVILAIDGLVDAGKPVARPLAEIASGLAFEYRAEPIGADVGRAAVVAHAAAGDFTGAEAALDALPVSAGAARDAALRV